MIINYLCNVWFQINIINMKITIDMTLSMKWFESRVNFKNLNDIQDLNSIDVSTVMYKSYTQKKVSI